MKTTIEAVYENGVFRPLARLEGIAEHQVTLTVTAEDRPSSLADLFGRLSADDAGEMRTIIRERRFQ
jgi:predicted DNA-binding antitoxin AbrB/MazE fold protein